MCLVTFMSVLAHVNLLLAAHMQGFDIKLWSAFGCTDLREAHVNLPMNLADSTTEVHPHSWSLFICMYAVHIARVPQRLHLTARAMRLRL